MRRRMKQQPNISLRGGSRVLEIVGTPDGARVTGVRCQTDEGPEAILADLVIDASKHGSLTLSFLKLTGHPVPEETTIGVDIRYATARFELRHCALGEFKARVTFPKAPEGVNAGYLLPVENNCYQLLLIGRGDDIPPTDGAAFLEYARKLDTPTIYNAMKDAMQLGEVARYGFPESKWRCHAVLKSVLPHFGAASNKKLRTNLSQSTTWMLFGKSVNVSLLKSCRLLIAGDFCFLFAPKVRKNRFKCRATLGRPATV
jgi:hypothetical protein